MTALAVGSLFVMLLIGLPVAFSLALAGLVVLYISSGPTVLSAVPQMMFGSLDSFVLLAIPFFILAADILVESGLAKILIDAINTLIGHVAGGLATVGVVATAFFAAISGSSSATAVAIGSVLAPEMIEKGYNPRYTTGLIAVAGGLGILIPPSIPMIVYGAVAQQSVGKLFLAGIVPGGILALVLIGTGMYFLGRDGPKVKRASWREQWNAVVRASGVLVMPAIIAVTIYGGIATPTEAAGLSVVYALFAAVVLYRGLSLRDLPRVITKSAGTSAMILLIIAGASVFAYVLTSLQIPQAITTAVLSIHLTPPLFLLIVNGILLVLGMFLDITSILLITTPIFLPIMQTLGINPIHFGVIFALNMELALITPPLGMNLFILNSITGQGIQKVLRGAVPFALAMAATLMLITYVPSISLWLTK